jgi:hypothetical protein
VIPLLAIAQIRGRVADGATGEPLSNVEIRCQNDARRVLTGADGRFQLEPSDPCRLRATSVSYRPATRQIDGPADVEISLMPDSLSRGEAVQVSAGPYASETADSVSLAGNELRNLAGVLADDPLRAVQNLPGVTAQDDFQSQFALRGAGFDRIGLTLDGILLHAPFHTLQSSTTDASLTNFQGEILESANLIAGPLPSRYGDRTAGILDFQTRDGSASDRVKVRVSVGSSNVAGSAEGRIGDRGTWLVAVRQSYLQYLLGRTTSSPGLAFAFRDLQAKLTYNLTQRNQVSLTLLDGWSGLNRSSVATLLGPNSLDTSSFRPTTAIFTWRFTLRSDLLITNRAAFLRERFEDDNKTPQPLDAGAYHEWTWNGSITKQWTSSTSTDAGASFRRIREDGFAQRLSIPVALLDAYNGSADVWSGFVQQSFAFRRFRVEAGARAESDSLSPVRTMSPFASITSKLWNGARITASFSQAAQFPEVSEFTSIAGGPSLLPERSAQAQLSFQQAVDESTRIRLDVYDREDRVLLFRPLLDPRILNGAIFAGIPLAPWENSERGRARGAEIFLQRRSANRLSGWIAYAYNFTQFHDGLLNLDFPSQYDSRSSVRVFASYRLNSAWNLSSKSAYGTGLPLPGFFEMRNGIPYLSSERNSVRLPDYQRTDFRVNKAFMKRKAQYTLFAEVVNVTNHANVVFDALNSYNLRTGQVSLGLQRTFPILPAAGIVIDF